MAGSFNSVDLSQLPAPQVVEALDYDTILAEMLADLQSRDPVFTALVESDPAYKVLEVAAYRELLIRQRVNEAAQSVMLAYATGADLDNLGANYGVTRLIITPANQTTVPPTPAVMELDSAYRARIVLSPEGYSCAGPTGAYEFFALSASGDVLDVSISQPIAGTVLVTVLSATGDGTAPAATLAAVSSALTPETVRPLCDTVQVQGAAIVYYSIVATLTLLDGMDADTAVAAATTAIQVYTTARHKVGAAVTLAGMLGALAVTGVEDVTLSAPGLTATLTITNTQASYCTSITVTTAATDAI